MGRIDHPNESDHIRRNPQDAQGKTRGSFPSDLVGDEMEQADNWQELIAAQEGLDDDDDVLGDVGNAQSRAQDWPRREDPETNPRQATSGMGGAGGGDLDDLASITDPRAEQTIGNEAQGRPRAPRT